ncbi:sensor histidine kinase [Isoptericola cucumis]|uniref:histidine kinase n=1 Tax=Isoptericola cucumis TaxID=1776856 RepID=A0ABQ2BC68_9MICO|nr:sensor histidine kinase [Isoptericola cucumis]GGI10621.1 two-component sensor histidine kinase [Isoptericola cucumis]
MTSRATAGPSPWVADVVLGLAMTLVVAVVIAADPDGTGSTGPVAYLFALGFGALVLLRRRLPRLMLVATFLAVCAYYALGFAPIGMVLPAVAALYSAAELGRTAWAVATGVVLIAVATYFRVVDDDPAAALPAYDLVTNVALTAAAIALGVAVRLAREARERTEQVRALTAAEEASAAARRLQEERLRIARDLHDTIGHTLSVVALHSGVAAEAVGRDDDAARGALARVRDATSGTLAELRATVKVLRAAPGPDRDAPRGSLGLAGLDALVAPATAAGLAVDVAVDVPPGAVSDTIDAAAYRVVQESLTNVLRHSGATRAGVRAVVADGRLRLTVVDDGHGAPDGPAGGSGGSGPAPGSGTGIAGMRERVALLGGTLDASDAAGGGFVVTADLPARLDDEEAR